MYNRESNKVWIVHDDKTTEQLGEASSSMNAYDLLAVSGFMRETDWRLVAAGSPLRETQVRWQ
jgi:hypothetical protein